MITTSMYDFLPELIFHFLNNKDEDNSPKTLNDKNQLYYVFVLCRVHDNNMSAFIRSCEDNTVGRTFKYVIYS